MTDLGLTDYVLKVEQNGGAFVFTLHFSLVSSGKMHSIHGSAASPGQAFDIAMAYVARVVAEAVVE